jgi:hypothetical protein
VAQTVCLAIILRVCALHGKSISWLVAKFLGPRRVLLVGQGSLVGRSACEKTVAAHAHAPASLVSKALFAGARPAGFCVWMRCTLSN